MATFLEQLQEDLRNQQPAFRPTALGLLNRPVEPEIKTPETFVRNGFLGEQGTQVAKELGLLGLSFAPGAGMADYFGQFPSAQGGYEPSFTQNVQQGNYLTAGLQGLGAAGDMAMAIPVLGAVVGSAAKLPRAAQKAIQGTPKVDPLGFFSQVEKSVMDIPQQKGTGQQFLAQIQKTPGVKPEELQYTGLDQFLANKPSVTKDEIQDYLDTNRVQLQEVRLENKNPYPYKTVDEFMAAISQEERAGNWQEVDRLTQAMEAQEGIGAGNATRYHLGAIRDIQTEIPGGTNYREVLLTLPAKQKPNKFTLRNNDSGGTVGSFDTMEEAQEFMQTTPREDIRSGNFSIQETASGTENVYRSSHFTQPNILAHMRLNDRTVDGKPTLFVEEIQSDWHQAGRKGGYVGKNEFSKLESQLKTAQDKRFEIKQRLQEQPSLMGDLEAALSGKDVAIPQSTLDLMQELDKIDTEISDIGQRLSQMSVGVPDAPFKTSWHELTLKKALNEAATKGYDQIAFTTGKTQAERYDLSKQINAVAYRGGDFRAYDMDGNEVITRTGVNQNEVEDLVGKEVAKKLFDQTPKGEGRNALYTLEGQDLSVGGEGMKGFYDKILPKSLEKLGKKYGVKPQLTEMDTPDGKVQVWKFPVPAEMRETIKKQGQPLFQIGAGAAGLGTAGLLATEEEQF